METPRIQKRNFRQQRHAMSWEEEFNRWLADNHINPDSIINITPFPNCFQETEYVVFYKEG